MFHFISFCYLLFYEFPIHILEVITWTFPGHLTLPFLPVTLNSQCPLAVTHSNFYFYTCLIDNKWVYLAIIFLHPNILSSALCLFVYWQLRIILSFCVLLCITWHRNLGIIFTKIPSKIPISLSCKGWQVEEKQKRLFLLSGGQTRALAEGKYEVFHLLDILSPIFQFDATGKWLAFVFSYNFQIYWTLEC